MKRKIHTIFIIIILLFAFVACEKQDNDLLSSLPTDSEVAEGDPSAYTVGFYAGGGVTRTVMLPNGLSAEWVAGDQIALWAKKSDGTYTLSNQIFKTYGIDSSKGFFTSTLSSAMPDDSYTYYCCYPVPESVDGTTATFSIPANQDGKATSGSDIMIATPVEHGALTEIPDPEDHSGMSMVMNRMMHQFRFYVPSDNTAIGNEKITKLVLTFPRDVVGKVALDLTNPNATSASILSGGSGKIVMNLTDPVTISGNYACMVMNPTAFAVGETVQVKAYTATQIAQVDPIDLCGRTFEAGHSTPVKLKVNAITDYPYSISFKVGVNNLGENPNSITFTAPQGCVWEGYDSNVFTYAPGREIAVGESVTIRFEDEATYRAFSGKSISVVYDSENTLTSQTVTVPDISSANSATISLTVPYLLYEDFSGISNFSDGHDNPGSSVSDVYKGITEMTGYALPGWYGTRVGGQAGTSVRICCRYEHVILDGAYYKGRIYTPFLSGIKDGKDVKISVSFKYAGNREEMKTVINWQYQAPDKSPILYFGINTQDVVTNPDQSEGDIIDSITGVIAGSGFSSATPSSLSPMVIKGEYLPKTGGSYTSFAGTKTVTISGVDNGMRLAWIVTTDNTTANINSDYWLYLDDIKVQITK